MAARIIRFGAVTVVSSSDAIAESGRDLKLAVLLRLSWLGVRDDSRHYLVHATA